MSPRRTRSLGEIADIRALERRAGEMRLGRAAADLQEKLTLKGEEQERQDARERRWAEGLAGRFDPMLARGRSLAMADGARLLDEASSAVSDAQLGKTQAIKALQMAQARAEAASDLERRARRQERHDRESRTWLDVSDSFIHRPAHED